MILSNCEIHTALDEGRLVIDPEPSPRQLTVGGSHCPYDTHSVDLKLHSEIIIPESGKFVVDLTEAGSLSDDLARHSKKEILTEDRPYKLKRGKFILARTIEKIALPISGEPPYLAARIEGKSSRARCGLLVHFTAPTVHPGFEGTLTLEIINLGPAAFMLVPGMYIAQLIVEQVHGRINQNPSQFQDQSTPQGHSS
ncbi:MAG: dCTP deaminase [Planctomycetes bacterium]|nr:dCTP deaminase [Planctomycetota bacterium]